jgi:hypothetical protein
MKRYCAIVGGIVAFLLVLFLVVEATGVPLLLTSAKIPKH